MGMVITTPTRTIECLKAVKGENYFNCYNEIGIFDCESNIKDWSLYTVEGGEFEYEKPSKSEEILSKIEYLAMMMEVDFDE